MKRKKTSFFSRENRWLLTLFAQVFIYLYVFYGAWTGTSKNASDENKQAAYWLNPKAYGYRKIRGDAKAPSLWDSSDPKEWILLAIVFALLPITYYLLRKYDPKSPHWLTAVMAFITWTHSGLLLLLLPINPFHKRFLYNFKAFAVEILNEPAKELFYAFAFIVLFPLPGSENATVNDRYTWLGVKMGLFYFFQTLLLGAPNYKLGSPDTEPAIFMSKKQAGWYGAIIILTLGLIVAERFTVKEISKTSV